MLKQMAAIRRKAGMTHGQFCDYVKNVHGELAKAKKSTLHSYVQNHIFDGAFGAATDKGYQQIFGRDMIVELSFASKEDMQTNFTDPYTVDVIRPDGRNFNDVQTALVSLVKEVPMEVANPREGDVKVILYCKKNEAISEEDFLKNWASLHQEIMASNSAVANAICRYSQHHLLPIPQPTNHFGGVDAIQYEGIACVWFEKESDLQYFEKYKKLLFENGDVFDESKSFFVYCKEVVII